MTTIVYKDGTMAADSRAYSGDRTPIGSKVKIRRFEDGTLLGASSTVVGAGDFIMDWFLRGRPDEKIPESFSLIVVEPQGTALLFDDTKFASGPIIAPYFAIGTGSQYALGAFSQGASALNAVKIACEHDVWSAMPIYLGSHSTKIAMAI